MNKYTLAKHKTLAELCEKQEQRIQELEALCIHLGSELSYLYGQDKVPQIYKASMLPLIEAVSAMQKKESE